MSERNGKKRNKEDVLCRTSWSVWLVSCSSSSLWQYRQAWIAYSLWRIQIQYACHPRKTERKKEQDGCNNREPTERQTHQVTRCFERYEKLWRVCVSASIGHSHDPETKQKRRNKL
jgi:hypothetical protein